MLTLRRNLIFPRPLMLDAARLATLRPLAKPKRLGLPHFDPLLEVRWGKVLALRAAIAAGAYNLEARLDDLLDDPPAELTALRRA